jgi:hypothetical protein
MLLALGLAVAASAFAQASPAPAGSAVTPGGPATSAATDTSQAPKSAAATGHKPAGPPAHYLPDRFAGKAGVYYKVVWGVDELKVRWAESGELVRFSWRVLDPNLAAVLNDKKLEPSLIDPHAGVSLVVPTMEKVGQLRQSTTPEVGRSYWIAFSNAGRPVKRGDRVSVVIGQFKAENLVVD